jgi:hypothetical protein
VDAQQAHDAQLMPSKRTNPPPPTAEALVTAVPAAVATADPAAGGSIASGAQRKKTGSADVAALIVSGEAELGLPHFAATLDDQNPNVSNQAIRVFEEVALLKPELCAPYIDRMVRLLNSANPRVVQGSAQVLPLLARVAPAKVARHLEKLRTGYDATSDVAKEGTVRTFVALCLASVAYQKRVVDVFEKALGTAEPKTLVRFTELVLPALKGEPHAQVRAVVEHRLPEIPRPQAEKIAELLGIRLRASRAP